MSPYFARRIHFKLYGPPPTMAPIKVCILGTGSSLSGLHYPSIASMPDKFLVHSVLERTPRGTAQAVCGPGVKVVQTLEEAVNDPEIELVCVLTGSEFEMRN
jgi:predicted dehydrogenase